MFNIERKELINKFLGLIQKGNLLVVGIPGSGKSWLMEKAHSLLREKNVPTEIIYADSIEVNSVLDFRKALGMDNSIEETLNYKSAGKKSILFIDALDAARGEVKQNIYRQFINLVLTRCENWIIVASIRVYDAKHSREMLNLFPSGNTDVPENLRINEIRYRHLCIPLLLESEIYEVFKQMPSLEKVYKKASSQQKQLFTLPFNIWLFNQLIIEGVEIGKLSDIQTSLQLFGLFWEYRVLRKEDSEDRKNILQRVTDNMVKNNQLSVNEKDIYIKGLNDTYKALKSDQLLVPISKSEQRLAFEHNMLFDYAVSRLLMREEPKEVFNFITEDKSRPIFIRQSIEYYFARLWRDENPLFWKTFCYFQYKAEEEYICILPVITFVKEINDLNDFNPIINKVKDKGNLKYQERLRIINRIFQVLKSLKAEILPNRDEIWIDIIFQLKNVLNIVFVDEYVRLLTLIIGKWNLWKKTDRKNKIAIASRVLLDWGWKGSDIADENQKQRLNEMLAGWGVPLVCKTFGENPEESKKILQIILDRLGPKSIIREIYSLVHEIEKIWPYDPDFVITIYKTVFSYKETSKSETVMRTGILTLTSDRRQDYEGCYYSLADKYSKFIEECPIHATRAMIEAVNSGVKRTETRFCNDSKMQRFVFGSFSSKYLSDGSGIWDEGSYREYNHLSILLKFRDYLNNLAGSESNNNHSLIINIIKEIAERNEVAVVWRYLLKIAISNPRIFVPILQPLFTVNPILTERDTTYKVDELLKTGFAFLNGKQREEVEKFILLLPKDVKDNENRQVLENVRARLLIAIPENLLKETESKQIIEMLKKGEKKLDIEQPFNVGDWKSKTCTEEDWLKEEGADLKNIYNSKLQDLTVPISKFEEQNMNKVPDVISSKTIFSKMCELKKSIEEYSDKCHEKVKESALTHLASACEKIARNNDITNGDDILKFCEEVFLIAGRDKHPVYNEEYHSKFDDLGWSPAPRIEAAEGIMQLVRRKEYAVGDSLNLVQELYKDDVPSVRYNIIRRLHFLYYTANEKMWEIANDIAKNEETNGVLSALVASISVAARADPDKVLDIFEIVCKRQTVEKRKQAGLLNDPCMSTITNLFIVRNNERANSLLKKFEREPLRYTAELSQVAISAIHYLLAGIEEGWKVEKPEDSRKNARQILSKILESTKKAFEKLHKKYGDTLTWTEERREITKRVYGIVDIIGRWLYYKTEPKKDKNRLSIIQLNQYYTEVRPLILQVISVGSMDGAILHASTAHNLMELCNNVLACDPSGVIKIAEVLCKTSAQHGYTLDSMAIQEVIKLIDKCIVDYKEIFQEKKNITCLMNILNIFIKAGWPEAIQYAIKLDEVWR